MATFDEQLASDFDAMLSSTEFGKSVTYRSKDDLMVNYQIDVLYGNALETFDGLGARVSSMQPNIYFRTAALAVCPQVGDEVDVDTTTYYVVELHEDTMGGIVLLLSEDKQ